MQLLDSVYNYSVITEGFSDSKGNRYKAGEKSLVRVPFCLGCDTVHSKLSNGRVLTINLYDDPLLAYINRTYPMDDMGQFKPDSHLVLLTAVS